MKTLWKRAAVCLTAWALMACGGGGGAGTSVFGTGDGTTPVATSSATSVDVASSSSQVGSATGEEVTLTAFVNGAGNAALSAAPVKFEADTGVLTEVSAVTNTSGVATAKFRAGSNKANRVATVTVTSGSVKSTVAVEIIGTVLTLSGPTTVALNGSQAYTVKATDSKGNAISGLAVSVGSSLGNGLSANSVTTSGAGSAVVTYTALRSGSDALAFTAAGTSVSSSITISGQDFSFVTPAANAEVPVGSVGQLVSARYLVGGAGQSGVTIAFSTTSGTLSAGSAVTDSSGVASVTAYADTAGPALIQARLPGNVAQATLPLEFVARVPSVLVLQVSPTAVAPNAAGATTQQAEVVAKVTDARGNAVKGQIVTFTRTIDPSGGTFSQPSALTDSSGLAKVQFIPGTQATSSDGVRLTATVVDYPSVSNSATLTVNQQALFIALGTGNVIRNYDDQTYEKDWTVYVQDSNGARVPGVSLTMKLLPSAFFKGRLAWDGTIWGRSTETIECPNEDLDYDGILDSSPNEDANANGTLEPGNVISLVSSNVTTNAAGSATVTLRYAESYAPWVRVKLQAKAVVGGTESLKLVEFVVVGASDDFNKLASPPAAVTSPFGASVGFTIDSLTGAKVLDPSGNVVISYGADGRVGCASRY